MINFRKFCTFQVETVRKGMEMFSDVSKIVCGIANNSVPE